VIAFEPFDECLVGGDGFDEVVQWFVVPLQFGFRRIGKLSENFFDNFTPFIFAGGGTSSNNDIRIGSDTGGVFGILSAEQGLEGKRSSKRISRLIDMRNGIHVLGEVVNERDEVLRPHYIAMLKKYLTETNGGAFVLFTSYQLLKRCAADLTTWLAENNLPLFVHGSGIPRSEMIRRFKESKNAVLFGTDSFWQGVDVPGNALRNVIITKLPFLVPNQPVVEAKVEAIQLRGGVPFREFQLPQAILKFKQGFGRLIRKKTDTGLVVVLDTRIQTKSYGRQFIESLPSCAIRVDDI